LRNFKLWKTPNLITFSFPEGRYFLNCDNTEQKRSYRIFFFCFRTASLGGSGLRYVFAETVIYMYRDVLIFKQFSIDYLVNYCFQFYLYFHCKGCFLGRLEKFLGILSVISIFFPSNFNFKCILTNLHLKRIISDSDVCFRLEIFYFPDRESIVTEQKIDFEILTDLYVLRSQESEKVDFKKCPSVCLSVCLSSVEVIVRTLLSRSI